MAQKYPGWSPYAYTLDNPIKYSDPNGMWVDLRNAERFVEMTRQDLNKPYGHDPQKGEVDCSQLVGNALSRMDKAGVKTALYQNMREGVSTAALLNAAKSNSKEYSIEIVDYDLSMVDVGDLIIAEGHVEIVAGKSDKGVSTVGASLSKGKTVERRNIDPTKTGKTSPWGNNIPQILKITEEIDEEEPESTGK